MRSNTPRIVSVTVFAAFAIVAQGACATSAPMKTYPGLKHRLSDIQRGNYELCETGYTSRRPNRGEQQLACDSMGDNYKIGTEGWFHYKALACGYSNPMACHHMTASAAHALAPDYSPMQNFFGELDRISDKHRALALRHGLEACRSGPSANKWASPETNGDTCLYSAILLAHLHPERKAEARRLVERGCSHYSATSACAFLERSGGKVDWVAVEDRQKADEAAHEERLERDREERRAERLAEEEDAERRRIEEGERDERIGEALKQGERELRDTANRAADEAGRLAEEARARSQAPRPAQPVGPAPRAQGGQGGQGGQGREGGGQKKNCLELEDRAIACEHACTDRCDAQSTACDRACPKENGSKCRRACLDRLLPCRQRCNAGCPKKCTFKPSSAERAE